ncbi:MAG: nucleoside deaminase [Bdellovibrionia bacterium]
MCAASDSSDASHLKWLEKALELARKAASEDEVPVGAVIIDAQGNVVGEGYNLREQDQNPVAHAEVLAIQSAAKKLDSWRLSGCTLYVTLEPCPMCLAACQQSRLTAVIYGARDPKGGALSLGYELHQDKRFNHRFPVTQVKSHECGAILSEFFSRKRKG